MALSTTLKIERIKRRKRRRRTIAQEHKDLRGSARVSSLHPQPQRESLYFRVTITRESNSFKYKEIRASQWKIMTEIPSAKWNKLYRRTGGVHPPVRGAAPLTPATIPRRSIRDNSAKRVTNRSGSTLLQHLKIKMIF